MEISLNINLCSKTNGSQLFYISSKTSFVKFEKIESADPYNLLAIRIDNQLRSNYIEGSNVGKTIH